MAHRGNAVRAPENTMAAFEIAYRDGADILETDLHVTRDGDFVCIHDATLERTTGRPGAVAELDLATLSGTRASMGHPSYSNETIPSLDRLLAWLPPDMALALELKSDGLLEPEIAKRLAKRLQEAGVLDRTAVLSFSFARCLAVRREVPGIPIGFVTLSRVLPDVEADLLGPLWPILFANPLYVWAAHRRGRLVAPLDPRPDSRLWFYRLLGCDAVLTDDPATTRRRLGRAPR